jgi:hypothetical protein
MGISVLLSLVASKDKIQFHMQGILNLVATEEVLATFVSFLPQGNVEDLGACWGLLPQQHLGKKEGAKEQEQRQPCG